jgi:hypothetical protein
MKILLKNFIQSNKKMINFSLVLFFQIGSFFDLNEQTELWVKI